MFLLLNISLFFSCVIIFFLLQLDWLRLCGVQFDAEVCAEAARGGRVRIPLASLFKGGKVGCHFLMKSLYSISLKLSNGFAQTIANGTTAHADRQRSAGISSCCNIYTQTGANGRRTRARVLLPTDIFMCCSGRLLTGVNGMHSHAAPPLKVNHFIFHFTSLIRLCVHHFNPVYVRWSYRNIKVGARKRLRLGRASVRICCATRTHACVTVASRKRMRLGFIHMCSCCASGTFRDIKVGACQWLPMELTNMQVH